MLIDLIFTPTFGGAPFGAVAFGGALAITPITPIPTGAPIGVSGIVLPGFPTVL